jgi:hypothetical protein
MIWAVLLTIALLAFNVKCGLDLHAAVPPICCTTAGYGR